ncbi:MAG: ABC transporter permease [Treponemataceae bacterium]
MNNRFFSLYKKELFLLMINPFVYGCAILFLAASAFDYLIIRNFFLAETPVDIRFYFASMPYIAIIIVPAFTMNLWTDEFTQGSLNAHGEFWFTLPVSEADFVLSKWLAVVSVFCVILLLSLSLPIGISEFYTIDFAKIASSYTMLFFFFCAMIAVGQAIALQLSNQIVCYILCAVILFACNSIHFLPTLITLPLFLQRLANQLSFAWHFDSASKGIFDTRDVVFYAVVTTLTLKASIYSLQKGKW